MATQLGSFLAIAKFYVLGKFIRPLLTSASTLSVEFYVHPLRNYIQHYFFLLTYVYFNPLEGAANSTLTYAERMKLQEEQEESKSIEYLIPKKLVMVAHPSEVSNETIPFLVQPKLRLYDVLDRWVENVGTKKQPWIVTASLDKGYGDPHARLEGNLSVAFVNGTAIFTNLAITHSGEGYRIIYNVTYPTTVSFIVTHGAHVIKEREFKYNFTADLTEVFDAMPFSPNPTVVVYDAANGKIVETGWKNREWFFRAELIQNGNENAVLLGNDRSFVHNGVGVLNYTAIDRVGNGYQIKFKIYTIPSSKYLAEYTSSKFDVSERVLYVKVARQISNCNDTVICGQQPTIQVRSVYPDVLAGNLGIRGNTWFVNASLCSADPVNPLLGTTIMQLPRSGEVSFTDLHFDYVASAKRLCFGIFVVPGENVKLFNLSAAGDTFQVKNRVMYLFVTTPPARANETVVFGQQPVVDVRDMGTGKSAIPLRTPWTVTASLKEALNGGVLSGNRMVNVVGTFANFTDLVISTYGVGFVLQFESNYGQVVSDVIQCFSQSYSMYFLVYILL